MAEEQEDYVQVGNENGSGDGGGEDKDAYIAELKSQITKLEETNKQQQFELQKAIHASYGTEDGVEPDVSEMDFSNMSVEEVGQQLLRTQQFLNTIRNERDRLQYQLADMHVADQKLRRRLSEQFTAIPPENKDLASFIQYMIAEEKMNHLSELKKAKNEVELELKKMQYQVADEKYEKMRLAKEKELKEKQLEYDIAEARLNEIKIAQKVADISVDGGDGGEMSMANLDPALLDPSELGKQLKDEIDRIKFKLAEEKMQVIALKKKNEGLETELRLEREKISAMGDGMSELGPPGQFNKQQSHQKWVDSNGHTREVSMPGFHKQFTQNFMEEINDLHGTIGSNEPPVDPNDPDISMELKKAYLEIQQLQKQLAQFTEQARDERALIWEKPRLTIQQISTFLRKLPDKHKEKMWERHCMGEYVKTDKVGSLLFSIVALCIKIHDRNVKTPQKGALLKKLEPYTKLLQSQIQQKEDPIGLTQEDFNDNLHEWLLLPLPIENLLSSTDREKLESELFETKKQLIEKDKEIFKERRKSKIFQESLAEIQKEADRYEREKKADNEQVQQLERRASQVMDEQERMNLELLAKDDTIKDQEQKIDELQERVEELESQLSKVRDSEDEDDDDELPERQPNGHSYYSDAQVLLKRKNVNRVVAHQVKHVPEPSANPYGEEKVQFMVNDENVTKSDIYIGWKRKAERAQELLDKEKENNEELRMKIKEYETMAEAYRSLQASNSEWKQKVQTMTDTMNEFHRNHADKTARRASIQQLHDTIAKGVVHAEAEHEKIVSGYERQIHNLTTDLNYITNGFENYKAEMDGRMNEVERAIREEEQQKTESRLSDQRKRYEIQLNEEENRRSNLQQQLNEIARNAGKADELEQENMRLADEIDMMKRRKEANMIAAAESMNQYRDIIKRLNDRVRMLSS